MDYILTDLWDQWNVAVEKIEIAVQRLQIAPGDGDGKDTEEQVSVFTWLHHRLLGYYNDVLWTSRRLKPSTDGLFVQQIIRANYDKNMKFMHVMTSSC